MVCIAIKSLCHKLCRKQQGLPADHAMPSTNQTTGLLLEPH
jgi:hypothetical protein